MAKRVDQVRMASTASNDGQRIGKRGATAEPLRLNGPETRQKLADASLQKSNLLWIERCREAAKLDRSSDPQTAGHGRDIEAQIDRADGPVDRTSIHCEFDVVAALRIEGDVIAALLGQRLRPCAGGEDDRMRFDRAIAAYQADLSTVLRLQPINAGAFERSAALRARLPVGGSSRLDRSYGPRPGKKGRRPREEAQAPALRPLRTSAIPVERRVRSAAERPTRRLSGALFPDRNRGSPHNEEGPKARACSASARQAGIASFSKPASAYPLRRARAGVDCRTKRDSQGTSAGKAASRMVSGLSGLKSRLGKLRRTSGLPTGAQA